MNGILETKFGGLQSILVNLAEKKMSGGFIGEEAFITKKKKKSESVN